MSRHWNHAFSSLFLTSKELETELTKHHAKVRQLEELKTHVDNGAKLYRCSDEYCQAAVDAIHMVSTKSSVSDVRFPVTFLCAKCAQ